VPCGKSDLWILDASAIDICNNVRCVEAQGIVPTRSQTGIRVRFPGNDWSANRLQAGGWPALYQNSTTYPDRFQDARQIGGHSHGIRAVLTCT
jgi:hypothetical protein